MELGLPKSENDIDWVYNLKDRKLINISVKDVSLAHEVPRKRLKKKLPNERYDSLKTRDLITDFLIWNWVKEERLPQQKYAEDGGQLFARQLLLALVYKAVKPRNQVLISSPVAYRNQDFTVRVKDFIKAIKDPNAVISANIFSEEAFNIQEEEAENMCDRLIDEYIQIVEKGLCSGKSLYTIWQKLSKKYDKEVKNSDGNKETKRFHRYLKTYLEFSYHFIYGQFMQYILLPRLQSAKLEKNTIEYFKLIHFPSEYLQGFSLRLLPIWKQMSNEKEFKKAAEKLILSPEDSTIKKEFVRTVAGFIQYYRTQKELRQTYEEMKRGDKGIAVLKDQNDPQLRKFVTYRKSNRRLPKNCCICNPRPEHKKWS